MIKKKFKQFSFLLCALLLVSSMTVHAKEVSETFESTDKDAAFEFPETMEEDGKKYILKDVQYEAVALDDLEIQVVSDYVDADAEYKPEQTITQNGITYRFVEMKEVPDAERPKVGGYTDYDRPMTEADVPPEKQITYTNEDGEQKIVTGKLVNVEALDGVWEDTYIDITFTSYGSYLYEWNGIEVELDDNAPLKGYEEQVLASVGADTTNFRITDISWNGDEYANANGELCRNARASVERFTVYYRANYEGEENVTKYEVTYEADEKNSEINYRITATAEYEADESIPTAVIVAGIGIVILAIALILFLIILSKKKKEDEERD